jgi:hypothetical protein
MTQRKSVLISHPLSPAKAIRVHISIRSSQHIYHYVPRSHTKTRALEVMSNSTWLSDAMMPVCTPNVFGPASCDGSFDFTLLFEQSILSIAPSAIFLCCLPVSLFKLHRVTPKFHASYIRTLKLVSSRASRNSSHNPIDHLTRSSHLCLWLLKFLCWSCGQLELPQRLWRQCLQLVLDSWCLWPWWSSQHNRICDRSAHLHS